MSNWTRKSSALVKTAPRGHSFSAVKPDVRVVAVAIVVIDGVATLYDRSGMGITAIDIDRLSGLPDTQTIQWHAWARCQKNHMATRHSTQQHTKDGWENRIIAMASSWRQRAKHAIRGRDSNRCGFRSASSWGESVSLMMSRAMLAKQNYKRKAIDPWLGWATSVSRNGNRRYMERYGTEN